MPSNQPSALTSLIRFGFAGSVFFLLTSFSSAQETAKQGSATSPHRHDWASSGPGWNALTKEDFAKVNSADDTWTFKDGTIYCTGKPVSVIRSKKQY